VVMVVVAVIHGRVWLMHRQTVMAPVVPFRVEIEAVPALPRSCRGPEPAAVRFKAAFRAALRPARSGLGMAGPRPA
jgi:hypothetical protein